MLYIKGVGVWHIGEPCPKLGRVVEFQADGDELNLFMQAMFKSSAIEGIVYTKQGGFQSAHEVDETK